MSQALRKLGRGWRWAGLAGKLGFVVTLGLMEASGVIMVSRLTLSIALVATAGSLLGMCAAGALSARRVREQLNEHNIQLDGAINNMMQGLCMFDAQNRLLVWNEQLPRYVQHPAAPHLAGLRHPRPARCAHRGGHLPARSRPLRNRAASGARAGTN